MSIQVYDVDFKDENNEAKTEKAILLAYFNNLVKKCRKDTKGKTYEEIEAEESFKRFQNRLGFFEDRLNDTINEMKIEVTYKPHKELLSNLYEEDCLYSWDYTEEPIDDLNTYVKCLRKKLKAVIKIYEQHEFKQVTLVRGYHYYAR